MAQPTAAAKKAFVESYGEVGSLHYFMTGPNLGGDWSWSKALAGGYSQSELDGYFNKASGVYKAHKTKSKATTAPSGAGGPDPAGGPGGPGAACAKTTAKAVVTAASEVKTVISQTLNHVWPLQGIEVIENQTLLDAGESLRKKLQALKNQLVGELGENAPEVLEVGVAIDTLKALDLTKHAQNHWHDFNIGGLQMFGSTGELLEDLYIIRNQLSSRLRSVQASAHLVDELLEAQAFAGGQEMAKLVSGWRDEVITMMDQFSMEVFTNSVADAAEGGFQYLNTLNQLAKAGVYDLESATEVVSKLRKEMGDYAEALGYSAYYEGGGALAGTAPERLVKEAFAEIDKQLKLKLADLSSPNGWLGGDVLQQGAPLTKYETFDDWVAALNKYENETQLASVQQLAPSKTVIPADVIDTLEEAFNTAKSQAGAQVPGPSTSALQFDVDMIKAAGTDELNPMVQQVLEANGETPSLAYFMSKGQKQDLLLEGWDAFDSLHYSVSYKGQTFEGGGLFTAKAKYAAKQGSPPPKATVHAEKMVGSAQEALDHKVVTLDAGGVDSVTGTTVSLPADAPSWYADPFTEKQASYLENLITKNALEEVFEEGGWYEAAKAGTLTKGQMDQAINLALKLDNEAIDFIDVSDVKVALNYGHPVTTKYGVSSVASAADAAADNFESLGKSLEDVLAPSVQGSTVSTAKPATSVAPGSPVWDAPHHWTYQGDGQSKWGGAHRKWWFRDEEGNDWMLKHGADFRSEGEMAAHKLAHVAGFDIAEARVVTLRAGGSSQRGVIQKMYRSSDIVGELDSVLGHGGLSDLGADTLRQLQEHQVLDWLIGNHDSHMQNFLVLKDGRLVGVDKGQAFKFYGKDRLAHDYKPAGNFGEIAYNKMWDQYRAGRLDLDLDVIDDALARIEAMSDDQVRELVRVYAEGRFSAGGSQAFLSGTSARSADELVELVLERKRTIRKQFEDFYQDQAAARGVKWEPSWSKVKASIHEAKPKVLSKSDVLTPIDEDLAASLNRVGTAGKAVYVSGTEVERGQILFDIVADASGKKQLRMHAYLRPEGNDKLLRILREEGGEAIGKSAGVVDDLPLRIQTVSDWQSKVVSAAKTVNSHISSGDFQFNVSTLAAAEEVLETINRHGVVEGWVKAGLSSVDEVEDAFPEAFRIAHEDLLSAIEALSPEDLDKFIVTRATEVAELRAMMTYRSHLINIGEQSSKAAKAAKVDLVPTFDAAQHFRMVRDEARDTVAEVLEGISVKADAPVKVFDSVGTQSVSTSAVRKGAGHGGLNDPVAILEGWRSVDGASGVQYTMDFRVNGKRVTAAYRGTDMSAPSMKGWLEVVMDTGDSGPVSAEDMAALHRWLNESVGVRAKLATSVDAELTYWRLVQGNYRLSNSYASGGTWKTAVDLADQRLRALGPSPTQEQEIEAIRGAYRQVFGAHVDDADVLPIHSHALSREADEIGWGYWERPELSSDDVGQAMDGMILGHSIRGTVMTEHAAAATGQGMLAQQERLRHGFTSAAMSAAPDMGTGGASGFFTRMKRAGSSIGGDYVVIAPHRRVRRLLDYNADHDSYGRIAERSYNFTLDPKVMRSYSRNSNNEFMLRDMVSYFDDVEMVAFSKQSVRNEWVQLYKDRGLDSIRGVPVEERFVYALRSDQVEAFFRKYVNPRERLRRSVADLTRAASQRVTQAAQRASSSVTSRFPVVKGGVIRKKVSAGRPARVYITRPGSPQTALVTRYHVGENAISVPEDFIAKTLADSDAPLQYGKATNTFDVGSGVEASPKGSYMMIDLSPFGFDIKTMPATKRKRFIQGFISSLTQGDGVFAEFIEKSGGVIP